MAENTTQQFTEEKFEQIDEFLRELKDRARKAHEAGDTYLLAMFNDMLAICSDVVTRGKARLERQEKAELNKKEKELRKKDREAREKEKAAREAASNKES